MSMLVYLNLNTIYIARAAHRKLNNRLTLLIFANNLTNLKLVALLDKKT